MFLPLGHFGVGRPALTARERDSWLGFTKPSRFAGRVDRSILLWGGFGVAGRPVFDDFGRCLQRHCKADVEISNLPGHDGDYMEIQRTDSEEFMARARVQLREALARCAPHKIVIGGISTGAVLAFNLAAEFADRVKGILLCAPIIDVRSSYHRTLARISNMCEDVGFFRPLREPTRNLWIRTPQKQSDKATAAQLAMPQLDWTPISSAASVVSLQRTAQRFASSVMRGTDIPICVLHGARDGKAHPYATERFVRKLQAKRMRFEIFPDSGHMLTLGREAAKVNEIACTWARGVFGCCETS